MKVTVDIAIMKRLHSMFCVFFLTRLYLQGEDFSPLSCEALLYSGWRRCGSLFYQIFEKPKHCIPRMIINLVNDFTPSRSQRHVCLCMGCIFRL